MTDEPLDVLVLGGGAAGLSGALTLARSRRSVLVLDAGEPRNAPAAGVHAFLTRDGLPPAELVRLGRAEVESYGGRIRAGTAVAARRVGDLFAVDTADGDTLHARRLLVATGLVDELPDLPGVRELWGRDVLHCPYCHGWEVRDRAVAVLGTGPNSLHQVKLFSQLTDDLVYLRHHGPALTADEAEQLAALDVAVIDEEVTGLEIADGRLVGARLSDGRVVARQALVVGPRFVARSALLEELGVEVADHPLGGRYVTTADTTGRTPVPGVWVAGNVTDLSAQVVAAAAEGTMAGARLNADLVEEDIARAVARHREGVPA
ncbi:NAD(P)/FAD-dependent oxidoreductase [Actinomycetospora lutea]|uniref:NAD(P)/FAD-dependent oxidoreductase n=1 Tax=Actinomycetospora lutea TaxID=663604 RepID=UPI002365D844|nr:NAD(P)/FAD-dependent oxidoreductase [Actinomycetospora lutea]MDD7938810.1 NAD(P)/FAD-dependent oxidoreductase [Actinomycetospora lutea]